jgi:hypothetical protein
MKEVYCGNCKYFCGKYLCDYDYEPECHHRSNVSLSGNWLQKFKVYNLLPKDKNNFNRCMFYKRLWYKFWVK